MKTKAYDTDATAFIPTMRATEWGFKIAVQLSSYVDLVAWWQNDVRCEQNKSPFQSETTPDSDSALVQPGKVKAMLQSSCDLALRIYVYK